MYFDINGAPAKYFYLTDLSNGAKGPVYAKEVMGLILFILMKMTQQAMVK